MVSVSAVMFITLLAWCNGLLMNIRPYKGAILRAHNYYRRLERAANMRALTWDYYLERRAARWSETCYFEHQRRGLGENLSYFTSTGRAISPGVVIQRSLGLWASEKRLWSGSAYCGAACHFTQLIWATTHRIGCALSYCPVMRTSRSIQRNAMYFACFYSPAGNYAGQLPYIPGRRCSRCGRGQRCLRGLCAGGRRRFGRRRRSAKMTTTKLTNKQEFLGIVEEKATGF